jgi:hypothetical protein
VSITNRRNAKRKTLLKKPPGVENLAPSYGDLRATHLLEPGDKFRTLQAAARFFDLLPKLKILVSVAVLEPQHSDFRHEGVLRLDVCRGRAADARAENRPTMSLPSRKRCLGHPPRCHRLRQSCCRPSKWSRSGPAWRFDCQGSTCS